MGSVTFETGHRTLITANESAVAAETHSNSSVNTALTATSMLVPSLTLSPARQVFDWLNEREDQDREGYR